MTGDDEDRIKITFTSAEEFEAHCAAEALGANLEDMSMDVDTSTEAVESMAR
jgi:serine protease inhibitor ecotin